MNESIWIVITTVNKPTRAVLEYSEIASRMGWRLLIVGDAKTPDEFQNTDCIFLSVETQKKFCATLANLIPLNHYCRKNIGYLYAIENGAEWIFDTDDDNIPLENFAESLIAKRRAKCVSHDGFVNVYKYFSDESIWPRGLPLTSIAQCGEVIGETAERHFPVQQFLADKDPDVDAIYRLVINREVQFQKTAQAVYLTPGTWSPFNSQATLIHRQYFRALYLPCFVPFRMTDIWRSLVAQKILWASGDGVVFLAPNVVQERNPHDYFKDFQDEILGYLHNQMISGILAREVDTSKSSAELLLSCHSAIQQVVGVVEPKELSVVKQWNSRLDALNVL